MTPCRLAIWVVALTLTAAHATAQPTQQPAQVPPGTVTTPTTVFVPAGGQVIGGQVPGSATTPGGPQMPARDVGGPGSPAGTGIIRGRITEAETGKPIRRATVQLTVRAARDQRVTSTNDDGRFEVRDLPAGDVVLSVRKPGYVSTGYGARSDMEQPRPIRLAEKALFDKADIALERGGVITGRVVDDYGEPVLEASVRVMRRRYVQGRQQYVPAGNFSSTNDIGEYRIFGLAPGDYYVSASLRGDFSRGESDDMTGYAPSYYPGTADAAAAQPVKVVVGTQSQADIALQPIKLGRILGLLLDSAGRPAASGRVMARRLEEGVTGMMMAESMLSGTVKPDGSFTINAVAPGRYSLQGMAGAMFSMGSGVTEAADGTVDVVAGEISTVTLTITRGGTLRGRIVVDGTPIESLTSLNVMASAVEPGGMFSGARPSTVNADGTFELVGVRGAVNIRLMGATGGTVMKSVRYNNTDVTTTGIDAPGGRTLTGIEIRITKDVAELSGTVTGARGELLKNYSVVVFHDDQRRWFGTAGRGFGLARPDQEGRYTVTGFLAGTYLVVALPEFDSTTLGDPAVMESLRAMATEVTLADGEKRVLDLRLAVQ